MINYYDDVNGEMVMRQQIGGDYTVYIGGIYEKNLTSGDVTKSYFAGGKRIAMRNAPGDGGAQTVHYLTRDHLGSTSLVTDANQAMVNRVRYYPFGWMRTQEFGPGGTDLKTDRLFTGQRPRFGTTVTE